MTKEIDIRTVVIAQLKKIAGLYAIDLKYVSDEQGHSGAGGVSRSPLEFTLECAHYNMYTAGQLRGEEPKRRTEELIAAFAAEHNTVEKAKAVLLKSVDDIVAAIEKLEPEGFLRNVMAPWGQRVTLLELTVGAVQHMFYHDGQLNYFQAIHGDDAVHWMEASG